MGPADDLTKDHAKAGFIMGLVWTLGCVQTQQCELDPVGRVLERRGTWNYVGRFWGAARVTSMRSPMFKGAGAKLLL